MNKLLETIRIINVPFDNYEDDNEYEHNLNIIIINKYIKCKNILTKMMSKYSADELETKLYETDCYGCTALHYACKYNMTKIACMIISQTTNESNLYKLSSTELTPLQLCCKKGRGKLQCVFHKIIEKTKEEDHLYLGKNHALQFCIINRDVQKAMTILERTHSEKNLYKWGLCYTSLMLSLEYKLLDISCLIIQKTQKERNLYLPNPYKMTVETTKKNAFSYLTTPPYAVVAHELFQKYEKINSCYRTTIRRIFHQNNQTIYHDDMIEMIGSFLYYGEIKK